MGEQTKDIGEFPASLKVTLRDSDDGRVEVRQLPLGFRPVILIEPIIDYDAEQVVYHIDATDMADLSTLADTLEAFSEGLRIGVVSEEEGDSDG